jgi:hypothetical protein
MDHSQCYRAIILHIKLPKARLFEPPSSKCDSIACALWFPQLLYHMEHWQRLSLLIATNLPILAACLRRTFNFEGSGTYSE